MKQQNQYQDFLEEQERYRRRRQQELQRYHYESTMTEEEREARRSGREEARRLRRRAKRVKKAKRMMPLLLALAIVIAGTGAILLVRSLLKNRVSREDPPDVQTEEQPAGEDVPAEEESVLPPLQDSFHVTPATVNIPDGTLNSGYAILIDLDEGSILAQRGAWEIIHPASMTKILTVLVAAEQIRDLNGAAAVSQETIDYCVEHDCSIAGFAAGEEVPVMDLFYGTILPSGADAAVTLAEYAAGSHEAFVELMNKKVQELGLSGTAHFANCVGLYDERNVCTVYDMAVILKAAMDNELCRRILGERIHDIPPSELHPEGISLSNWFIRRIEDHMPEGVAVKGAKTGFINQSGNCSASMAQDAGGRACLCVTAMAGSSWQCIFDHVTLYTQYGFNALEG